MKDFIAFSAIYLELGELLRLARCAGHAEHVETDSLRQRTALANSHNITLVHTESRADVGSKVLVALLITIVLGNVVQVLTTDDNGAVHLGRNDSSGENATTDRYLTNEGALLVNVSTTDSLFGGLEAKTNLLVPPLVAAVDLRLGVIENVRLLLEGALRLDGKLSSHGCGDRSGLLRECKCLESDSGKHDQHSPKALVHNNNIDYIS